MRVDADRVVERPQPSKKEPSFAVKHRNAILGGAGLVLAIGVGGYLISQSGKDGLFSDAELGQPNIPPINADPSATVLDTAAPEPLVTDAQLAPVERPPALDGSDSQVEAAIQDLSPTLLQWLTPDEQIRKWVMMVVNMADGAVLNKHQPIRYPMKSFKTKDSAGRLTMSSANYERAKPLVKAVMSIPPDKLAAYYRQWTPVLTSSFVELGLEGTFHGHFVTLLDNIIITRPHDASPSLEQPNVLYEYADPVLERASDLEKLLWRLGPSNMAEVQAYAAELKAAL